MKDLAPRGKGKTIRTTLGDVDIGHVLAAEFDDKHKLNEDRVGEKNRLVSLVDNLLDLLAEIMP